MSEPNPPEFDDALLDKLHADDDAQPPAELDAAVLAMARANLAKRPHSLRNWLTPLVASAAVVMLTTSIVLNTPPEAVVPKQDVANRTPAASEAAPSSPADALAEPSAQALPQAPVSTLRKMAPEREAQAGGRQFADMQELRRPPSEAAPRAERAQEEAVAAYGAPSVARNVAKSNLELAATPLPGYRLQQVQCITAPCPPLVLHAGCVEPFALPGHALNISVHADHVSFRQDEAAYEIRCTNGAWSLDDAD